MKTLPAGNAQILALDNLLTTWAANDAAVLFSNADNPGNPRVQAILRQLGTRTLAA